MHRRFLALLGMLAAGVVLALAPSAAAGQSQSASGAPWTAPRTPWGDPDLQGLWNNSTTTPLERPEEFADREFLTPEELARLNEERRARADRPPPPGNPGSYNEFWFNRGSLLRRTSLIVDPPDGRVPAMTPDGERRASWEQGTDSWEDRNLAERCLTRGAPRRPGGYNNNFHILQTPGLVAIFQEMVHEVRFIPLDGRPPLEGGIRQWVGDSRGRWEGDTLVVETANFPDGIVFNLFNCCPGSGGGLRLTERFTRTDADTIDYRYTVNDPTTYARPWTVAVPMIRFEGPLYEYACHEGNVGLENILRGARALER